MISFLTMSVTAITNAIIYVLKAFFSLVLWFVKFLLRGIKICYSLLPLTTLAFVVLIFVDVFLIVTKQNPFPEEIITLRAAERSTAMMDSLRQWWIMEVYSYKGNASYYLLLFISVMMFLPVMTVFLSISVFLTFGRLLFFALIADGALYIILTFLGKPFFVQALDRYYRLFPDAGIKHEEKNYARLLKMRNRELQNDLRRADFYRDSDFYSSDDERYRENDYVEYVEEYDEEEFDEEFDEAYGEDDEFYEDYEYEEDGYDVDKYEADEEDNVEINADMFAKRKAPDTTHGFDQRQSEQQYKDTYRKEKDNSQFDQQNKTGSGSAPKGSSGSFDFFAGCSSRESVDKKYKSLVKLYHPDNMDGDTAALQEINVQYAKAKKQFET
ncbi:MAG: hypothetical protein K6E91_11545 [Butyrivibrio sp.]|nr:hypothetical protein [Butyrivibrio sp.]